MKFLEIMVGFFSLQEGRAQSVLGQDGRGLLKLTVLFLPDLEATQAGKARRIAVIFNVTNGSRLALWPWRSVKLVALWRSVTGVHHFVRKRIYLPSSPQKTPFFGKFMSIFDNLTGLTQLGLSLEKFQMWLIILFSLYSRQPWVNLCSWIHWRVVIPARMLLSCRHMNCSRLLHTNIRVHILSQILC